MTGADRGTGEVGGALLVAGTASGVGKSTVTAGLCASFARRGVTVAPFKAQNMSNHAAVTADGGEVGRAQAEQARAAGIDVERAMNPILLKPSSATGSHVVVCGDEVGRTDARAWGDGARDLRGVVLDAFASLRSRFDLVVAEGAGGAAEINLLDRDLVNLPLAHAAGMPVVLVVDIEPGGAFAAAHGTIDLVPRHLAATVAGLVFNRFRGDVGLLESGIAAVAARTGVPTWGVLPHLGPDGLLGVEDSLDLDTMLVADGRDALDLPDADRLRVAVVRLPHLANPSDLDALRIEPGVSLTWATRPEHLRDADLVVVPGSRATVADLGWLRDRGLDRALADTSASILGICAGLQVLGRTIHDGVESDVATTTGLGLVDATTTFGPDKVVDRATARLASAQGTDGPSVHGYRIHSGRVTATTPWLTLADGSPDGAVADGGRVVGTSLHGILDDDAFRRRFLAGVAARHGRRWTAGTVGLGEVLAAQDARLADWVDAHLDLDAVGAAAATAAPADALPGWR